MLIIDNKAGLLSIFCRWIRSLHVVWKLLKSMNPTWLYRAFMCLLGSLFWFYVLVYFFCTLTTEYKLETQNVMNIVEHVKEGMTHFCFLWYMINLCIYLLLGLCFCNDYTLCTQHQSIGLGRGIPLLLLDK